VAIMVGRARTQLDIVEITAMKDTLVVVDAAALGQGIDREGRASVYGIHFDTDRAGVKPDSRPSLDETAKFLRERASLTLFVVGHTDMTGDRAHNQALSEARARAVVQALVKDYGIAAARLEGYGVGPLAPVATNADAAGRAKNRRVELVAR
jgi:outer membrane protein OmpA-like peptidoglycan-associated protein